MILEPELFTRVLNSIKNHPKVAVRFFHWVGKQPGFKPSDSSFVAILEILAVSNSMNKAYLVMEKVVCGNLNGVVSRLIDGSLNDNVARKVLDLYFCFCRKSQWLNKGYTCLI